MEDARRIRRLQEEEEEEWKEEEEEKKGGKRKKRGCWGKSKRRGIIDIEDMKEMMEENKSK